MGERKQEASNEDAFDDFFDVTVGEMLEDEFEEVVTASGRSEQAELAVKRRRAEARLEALRLREELGDYDFDFDDL
ncbi:hypothetical protein NOR51B_666 [Luminiphilus syltensis NOR5-1B]|uniref:Uncharacterized protein n=1 Tax=Luminiphilus syltensis NOR5-1B TaxID=565045 RepID=B8KUW6_9GAMM|nr:hypothetical protein [Luminiphilus syltensis]EED34727.1 hypothetical protein NOR51B_666 [Luminiphilus syltensis NOR5-1B]